MQQLKHDESRRLCDGNEVAFIKFCNFASSYLHDGSLLMLMSRRSGILLFNSRGTCILRTLSGYSRRRFNVNMGFTNDDRILIENLYIFKGYGAKNLLKSFQIKVVL